MMMRRPPLTRALIAAAAFTLLLYGAAAVACGGGGGGKATSTPASGGTPQGTAGASLTAQEYFRQLGELNDQVSAELDAMSNEVATALPTDRALEALRTSIAQQASILQELQDGIEQLSPPPELQGVHQEAIDALAAFIDYAQEASAQAEDARDIIDIAAIIDNDRTRAVNGRLTDACAALQQAAASEGIAIELACGE